MSRFTEIKDEKDVLKKILNRQTPAKFVLKDNVQIITKIPHVSVQPRPLTPMKNKLAVKIWDQNLRKVVTSTKKSQGPFFMFRDEKEWITSNMIKHGHWEGPIIERAKQHLKSDSIVLDIGANIGAWTLEMALKCKDGHVYAFEPQKNTFMQLCGNIFLNRVSNVTPFQVALGNSEQHGMVFEMEINKGNNGASFIGDGKETGDTKERVEMVALDYYEFKNVKLIKIDVEGFEVRVLEGAIDTIMDSYPVIFFEALPSFPVHKKYLLNLLNILGYTIYKVPESKKPDFFGMPPSKEHLKQDEEKTKLSLLKSLFKEYNAFVEKNSYRS